MADEELAAFDFLELLGEMKQQNLEAIRFSVYRTACKLRFVQRRSNLYLVDIWNVIESFRDCQLNVTDLYTTINSVKVKSVLTSIFLNLNKRLPQKVSVEYSVATLLSWLQATFQGGGEMRVFSVKIALAVMCQGRLTDKLKYIFTQLSDSSGRIVRKRFDDFLTEIVAISAAIGEGAAFQQQTPGEVPLKDGSAGEFVDLVLGEAAPQSLLWLPVMHRMAAVEHVFHPVRCDGCGRESFAGFRYKCQTCSNYQLCQDCFWRGRTTGRHSLQHPMKEYTTFTQAKPFTSTIRKSVKCIAGGKSNQQTPPQLPHHKRTLTDDEAEKPLDLKYVVPSTPIPSNYSTLPRRSNMTSPSSSVNTLNTRSLSRLTSDVNRIDDEHRLIARYAAKLGEQTTAGHHIPQALRSPSDSSIEQSRAQRELLASLEEKNREILREIRRLKATQQDEQFCERRRRELGPQTPVLNELTLLRRRKDELESRMSSLQESRRDLMRQLESLMHVLKSPRSPRQPPLAAFTPAPPSTNCTPSATSRLLRADLFTAADGVTSAMGSLVRELNSEQESSDDELRLNGFAS